MDSRDEVLLRPIEKSLFFVSNNRPKTKLCTMFVRVFRIQIQVFAGKKKGTRRCHGHEAIERREQQKKNSSVKTVDYYLFIHYCVACCCCCCCLFRIIQVIYDVWADSKPRAYHTCCRNEHKTKKALMLAQCPTRKPIRKKSAINTVFGEFSNWQRKFKFILLWLYVNVSHIV